MVRAVQGKSYGQGQDVGLQKSAWSQRGERQHGVQFYSQDKFLLQELSEYIGNALRAGNAAVVVATEQHRNALLQWLVAQGVEVAALVEQGRFVAADAQQLLARFMVDGSPHQPLFEEAIGGIVEGARSRAAGSEPRVAIFGEMVALLWEDGKADAAICLEQLWNDLAKKKSFSLFCAYPMSCFNRPDDAAMLLKVCNEHSAVIPTEGYMRLASEDARLRSIAELQQKARALETEVEEHKRLRQELELHVQARTAELQSKNAQLMSEIKRRQDAETSLRTLTSQLMLIRDEERRRVAHELHESTAQVLATLSMNLGMLRDTNGAKNPRESRLMVESASLVDALVKEVCQLSHLLHPPTLEDMGLPSALLWYAEKVSERSKIDVTVEIAKDFGRLSHEKEIAVFRVVQESLANVAQHSGSTTATVRISKTENNVCVQVSDFGRGMPAEASSVQRGVGISGMRERLRQLGGTLSVHSNGRGTLVTADVPIT
jgi:signal transduction histidine kinase